MYRLGVIPAGGKGSRWGGYLKEMLPVENGTWLIDHTIETMTIGAANAVLVITSPEKVGPLAKHLTGRHDIPVLFAVENKGRDIWGGIEESFAYPADTYLFAMPDTYYPTITFADIDDTQDFQLGTFHTDKPERFGIITDGMVKNKQQLGPGTYKAWGVLAWSKFCVKLWQEFPQDDYTAAINLAINAYGLHTFDLAYYYDMATFEDYQEFLSAGIL